MVKTYARNGDWIGGIWNCTISKLLNQFYVNIEVAFGATYLSLTLYKELWQLASLFHHLITSERKLELSPMSLLSCTLTPLEKPEETSYSIVPMSLRNFNSLCRLADSEDRGVYGSLQNPQSLTGENKLNNYYLQSSCSSLLAHQHDPNNNDWEDP